MHLPSTRPLVVYDAACAFCRPWVRRWQARTGDRVRYASYQSRASPRLRAAGRRAMLLREPDGRVFAGADAVFRLLSRAPGIRWLGALGRTPGILHVARVAYRFIAGHRAVAHRVDRLLFAGARAPARYDRTRSVFLRGLGLVYLLAFTSLRVQVRGLLGERGILPAKAWLEPVREHLGAKRFLALPTLFWFDCSDRTLVRAATAGQLFALALLLGILPWPAAALCWLTYLSFVTIGRDFLQFQWDQLLVETGLHALTLAPLAPRLRDARHDPSWVVVALLRLHAFRFHFESGLAKWQSGDRTWRERTACGYYYETAPLPTRLGWWAHHLPPRMQRFSTTATLVIECLVPFLGLGPRGPRRVAFGALMFLQVLIAATGNYGFFNLLTAVLSVWLLEDSAFERITGRRPGASRRRPPRWRRALDGVLATPLVLVGAGELLMRFGIARPWTSRLMARTSTLLLPGSYGLFSVMTRERPEITIEGTDDGVTWREYTFRYKAGDPMRAPRWVAPHQPRLDWQMWFAALGPPPGWFVRLLRRLLEGAPEVHALFADVPFRDRPPLAIRATRHRYRMTDLATHRATGAWWKRERLGEYVPPIALPREARTRSGPSTDRMSLDGP